MDAEVAGVEKAIDEVAGAPLREATEACEAAVESDDPETAVERWETALDACHEALTLVLRHGDVFDGDPDSLRFRVEWAAQRLVAAHRTRAEEARARGDSARESGDVETAREAYDSARAHYEAARGVAAEFRSCDPERIERARDALPDELDADAVDVTA
jgi:hypothetical protein